MGIPSPLPNRGDLPLNEAPETKSRWKNTLQKISKWPIISFFTNRIFSEITKGKSTADFSQDGARNIVPIERSNSANRVHEVVTPHFPMQSSQNTVHPGLTSALSTEQQEAGRVTSDIIEPKKKITAELRGELSAAKSQNEAQEVYKKVNTDWYYLNRSKPYLRSLNLDNMAGVIGAGGLNVMIGHVKSQPGGENMNCLVCDNLEALKEAMDVVKSSQFEGKIAFLVRSNQRRRYGITVSHITPVLVEKKADKTNVFIMDSINADIIYPKGNDETTMEYYEQHKNEGGGSYNPTYAQNVYEQINEARIPNVSLYLAKSSRQTDGTNCPIFSFNDVKHFFKHKNFFEDIVEKGGIVQEPNDPELWYVTNLPPENMKLTQSMTKLNEYLDGNDPDVKTAWFAAKGTSDNQWTLEKSMKKNTRVGVDKNNAQKQLNMKAADRYHKYLYVIKHYAERKNPEEMRELTTRYDSKNLKVDTEGNLTIGSTILKNSSAS